MQPIDRKPDEVLQNNFYGIDVNNHEAVKKEFERLQKQHRTVTIVVVIVLLILSFFIFDFIRVTELGGKPVFVLEKKIEDGTKFVGIGYEVLYCNNGERYVGSVVYKKCVKEDSVTVSNFVYKKFVDYVVKNKLLDKSSLDNLVFTVVEFDSSNDDGSNDYHVNLKYTCKNRKKCLKLSNEYYTNDNVNLYVRLDKYNEVSEIMPFKNSGLYYDKLIQLYLDKLKTYMIVKKQPSGKWLITEEMMQTKVQTFLRYAEKN
jgi:hypothetical protein